MNTDFRNRMVLPFVLPLAVLLGVAVVVGGLALILLYTPRDVGLIIALVVASGVMVAFSLANSIDEEDMTVGRRAVIFSVGALPLLGGAAAALWTVNGGVPEDQLATTVPAYYEAVGSAPEGALVGAQNSQSFCVFEDPADDETCEDTSEVTLPAQPDGAFFYEFRNLESGVPHNFQIFELAGSADDPGPGEELYGTDEGAETINGVDEIVYEVPAEIAEDFEQDAQFYYNCVVHPAMQGVLTIGPPAEEDEG